MSETKTEMKVTTIQLPDETFEALKEIAKQEDRSISAQIRVFLTDAVTRLNTVESGREEGGAK